jgi:hypothetical protein
LSWNYEFNSYNFWLSNDDFFSYGPKGSWYNDAAKLKMAWNFLDIVDFGSKNWIKAGGYNISGYESRRVQTIQAKMGTDVTGCMIRRLK